MKLTWALVHSMNALNRFFHLVGLSAVEHRCKPRLWLSLCYIPVLVQILDFSGWLKGLTEYVFKLLIEGGLDHLQKIWGWGCGPQYLNINRCSISLSIGISDFQSFRRFNILNIATLKETIQFFNTFKNCIIQLPSSSKFNNGIVTYQITSIGI